LCCCLLTAFVMHRCHQICSAIDLIVDTILADLQQVRQQDTNPPLYKTHVRDNSDLTQHTTWANISQNVEAIGQWRKWEAVVCMHGGKRTWHWTCAKLKPALFRANTLHNRLFSEPPTVYRGKHVVSHHFHHSYLKANKISKSEGIRKIEYAYHFWKCADTVHQKLSKLLHACRNYSLPKLASFLRDCIVLLLLLFTFR